jgi:hypothetical protein
MVLEAHAKSTGRTPLELEGPGFPLELSYVWAWFIELDEARGVSFAGASPISFTEMQAWAALTGRVLLPNEVRLIRRLDRARTQNI